MLHVISLVAVAVVVVLYAVTGVLTIATGRVVPWQRERLLRPRLWGSGALVFGAGMALARFGGSVRDLTLANVVFACSLLMLVCGGVMQYAGQRAGRVRA